MNVAAVIDHTIALLLKRRTLLGRRILWRQIVRSDRRLAVTAGNIEYELRLAQSGYPASQRRHQLLAARQRGAQMRRATRAVAMMQIIRLYPPFNQGSHQRLERRGIVIDAAQQHRLADEGNAGVD